MTSEDLTMNPDADEFDMPCLLCGEAVRVRRGGLEDQGVLSVFCRDKDCEDTFAARF